MKDKLQAFFRSNGKTNRETSTPYSIQTVCDKISTILAIIFFIGILLLKALTVHATESTYIWRYIGNFSEGANSWNYETSFECPSDINVYGIVSSDGCFNLAFNKSGSNGLININTFMSNYGINEQYYRKCTYADSTYFDQSDDTILVPLPYTSTTFQNVTFTCNPIKIFDSEASLLNYLSDNTLTNGLVYEIEEEKQPIYTYNPALDFAQISAEYNVKYTIKKDLVGAWNFISSDEAGIQFNWTNNSSVDDAYLKFDVYGTFYDSMWATSGTYTHVTVSGVNKSDCAYLLQQNNLVELARQVNGSENGHGLDINYIYVQAYGIVDGVLSRSRIYKFNNELISDYGNASAEYDEYVPEITSGYSMPTDYELDETLTDPEVTEPSADTSSTTVITTPIDDLGYTSYYDEESLLKALTKFYDMLKNMVSTLGQFPTLFANVFSFLPNEITVLICGSLLACIFLRFIGR